MADEPDDDVRESGPSNGLIVCIVVFYALVFFGLSFPPVSEFSVNATLLR